MSIISRHMQALGLDDLHLERAKTEMIKAQHMTRAELTRAIESKQEAIKILRVQQAALLVILETR